MGLKSVGFSINTVTKKIIVVKVYKNQSILSKQKKSYRRS